MNIDNELIQGKRRGRPARPISEQEMEMLKLIKEGMQDKDAAAKVGLKSHSWIHRRRLESAGLLEKRGISRLNGKSFLIGRMWADGDSFSEISREFGVSRQRVFQIINQLKDKGVVKETKSGKRVFVGE